MSLTKRSEKGEPLSAAEHDANLDWFNHGAINVKAFGAVGNNSTDDFAAIMAACDAAYEPKAAVIFPPGMYYVSQTLRFKWPVRLTGYSTGFSQSQASILRFPVDTRGIHFEARETYADKMLFSFTNETSLLAGTPQFYGSVLTYTPSSPAQPYAEVGAHLVGLDGAYYLVAAADADDHDATTSGGVKLYNVGGTPPRLGQAAGGSVENISLYGGGGTNREGHGIKAQCRILIRDVFIKNFPGDGLRIAATADSAAIPGVSYGNANRFVIHALACYSNGRDGIHISGSDANAGSVIDADVMLNSRFGINERSYLGNTYVMAHSDGNGSPGNMPGLTGGNGADVTSLVWVGTNTNKFAAHPLATPAQLVETSPEDDTAVLPGVVGGSNTMPVWIPIGGLASGYAREWEAEQPEGTYVNGGNYIAMGATQRNTFVGCYEESGGAGHYIAGNNMAVGGFWSETMVGGPFYAREGGDIRATGVEVDGGVTISLGGDNGAFGPLLRTFKGESETHPWRECLYNGDYILLHQNSTGRIAEYLTGSGTAIQFGTGAPVPYIRGFPVLGIGSGSTARRHTNGTAIPSTGAWAQGDIVWNVNPSAGGNAGWICTSAGTPGTWRTFGAISET